MSDALTALRNADAWSEDTIWTRERWRAEVAAENTQLGYWEWAAHQQEANADDG